MLRTYGVYPIFDGENSLSQNELSTQLADLGSFLILLPRGPLEETTLNTIYDVFKKYPDGQVWVEAVEGLENVRGRVMKMMMAEPGEYCVYDLIHKRVVLQVSQNDAVHAYMANI